MMPNVEGIRGLLIGVIAALAAVFAVAGCGGGSGDGGNSPASVVPQSAPLYLEASLTPTPKEEGEIDALARAVLGVDSAREFLSTELEQAALASGEKLDFEKEVEPWLGERAGLYLAHYDDGAFHGFGLALETTDPAEAEEFVEGHENAGGGKGGTKLGVVGDYVVFGETKANVEEMVKVAEDGESLAESSKFESAMEAAPTQGVGHAYVDFGGLISQSEGQGSAVGEVAEDLLGAEARNATAVATVVPHSKQIEIDISTNATGAAAPGGDASALLESMPASADAAFASAEFGERFGEIVDQLDENGIPGQIKPGGIKLALGAVGINIDAIAESLGDVGGFLEGSSQSDVGGALLVETNNASEAKKTIANLGRLLRLTGTPGVTATSGELNGFSIRSPRFGPQPLIIGAADERIVIAYGAKAAAQALRKQGATLGVTPDFEAARKALGSTPIGAFVTGGSALTLAAELLTPEHQLQSAAAKPLLRNVSYIGAGSEAEGSQTVVRVIIGVH